MAMDIKQKSQKSKGPVTRDGRETGDVFSSIKQKTGKKATPRRRTRRAHSTRVTQKSIPQRTAPGPRPRDYTTETPARAIPQDTREPQADTRHTTHDTRLTGELVKMFRSS